MKKNKLIEHKLNRLADSVRLNPDTVRDAVFELNRVEYSRKSSGRRMFSAVAAVCAVILIVFVSVFIVRGFNNQDTQTIVTYKLDSLQENFITDADSSAVPFSELENAELQQKSYSQNGEIEVVATKIINVTEHGTDQIIVYQDIGSGLTDFSSYRNFSAYETDETSYTMRYEYKNGEYYSYCYYSESDVGYYIIIMSPYSDAAAFYFENV